MTKSVFTKGYQRFRRMLIKARKTAGLKQVDLASRLGRHQSFVSKYEAGERRIDVIEFLEIADAIKVDPGEFIRRLRRELRSKSRQG